MAKPLDPFTGVNSADRILQASTQVQIYMPSSHNNLNELSLLMELRLAFGPGTRLWAYRSREDLCYDWLHFKERRANACFREFALGLYIQEKEQALHCASLNAISKAHRRDLEGVSGQETTSHCAGHRQPAAVEWRPGATAPSRPASAFAG